MEKKKEEKMIHIKPFEQRSDYCGPASLKMVLHHFKIEKTEKQIINAVKAKHGLGIEAEDLLKYAKKLGLKGKIKDHSELGDLTRWVKKKKIPVIIEWFEEDDGHFSVVTDIDRENVYLQDPDLGHIRAMRRDIFLRVWFTFPTKYLKRESDLILRRMLILYK
jgi:predicted double-glycine peptidase